MRRPKNPFPTLDFIFDQVRDRFIEQWWIVASGSILSTILLKWSIFLNWWSILHWNSWYYIQISQNDDRFSLIMINLRTWKCITLPLNEEISTSIFQSCQNEHALFGRKMCNVANTRFLDNFCGRYFGRYNAVWSIFGLFLLWSIFITTPLAALYLSRDVKVYHSAIKWRNTKISANILFNMYLLPYWTYALLSRMCNVTITRIKKTFWVNILVDIMPCGQYLVNFVVVDIYYNPTGRSGFMDQFFPKNPGIKI